MIAKRASSVGDSITMAITAYAQKLKKEGLDVINFGAGEPDFDTPEFIQESGIKAIRSGKTRYTAATGILELKEAVASSLKQDQNLVYTPSQIVISCGAKHSIFNAMMALIDPGDEVLIPSPYWVSYPDQVHLCGGIPVFIPTSESTAFKITAPQLKAAITPKTKLLILNSPSNPTGSVYTKSELVALAEVILAHRLLVLSDEIYEKLVYGNVAHISIASLDPQLQDLTILVNGLSKAYAMTGWRIGYSASPLTIATAMGTIQSHCTSNANTPSQWAGVDALIKGDASIATMRLAFEKRKNEMVALLNHIPGVHCLNPDGAFYTFPTIASLMGKSCKSGVIKTDADFCQFLLKEALVACIPGSGFGAEGFIRLSYATSLPDIHTGLSRMKQWIESLT